MKAGADFLAAGPDARSSLPAIEGRRSDIFKSRCGAGEFQVALWPLTFLAFDTCLVIRERCLAAKNEVRTSTLPELDQSHRIPLHPFRDAQLRCVTFTMAVATTCDCCYRQFANQASDRDQDELRYPTVSFDTHPA